MPLNLLHATSLYNALMRAVITEIMHWTQRNAEHSPTGTVAAMAFGVCNILNAKCGNYICRSLIRQYFIALNWTNHVALNNSQSWSLWVYAYSLTIFPQITTERIKWISATLPFLIFTFPFDYLLKSLNGLFNETMQWSTYKVVKVWRWWKEIV